MISMRRSVRMISVLFFSEAEASYPQCQAESRVNNTSHSVWQGTAKTASRWALCKFPPAPVSLTNGLGDKEVRCPATTQLREERHRGVSKGRLATNESYQLKCIRDRSQPGNDHQLLPGRKTRSSFTNQLCSVRKRSEWRESAPSFTPRSSLL